MNETQRHLVEDILIISMSVGVAVFLGATGVLSGWLTGSQATMTVGSFVAGLCFTSVFTTAPAIIALGEIAQGGSVLYTALIGAAGAVIGDLIIFAFVRDRFTAHVLQYLKHGRKWNRFRTLIRTRNFRWASFFVGGLIIASPFPDELGISLMGISHLKTRWFIPLSYALNFLGIVAIGLAAKALAPAL